MLAGCSRRHAQVHLQSDLSCVAVTLFGNARRLLRSRILLSRPAGCRSVPVFLLASQRIEKARDWHARCLSEKFPLHVSPSVFELAECLG